MQQSKTKYFNFKILFLGSIWIFIFLILPLLLNYNPNETDALNAPFKSPFEDNFKLENGQLQKLSWFQKHWLGTDQLGRDVFSGIVYGLHISIFTGLSAAFLSLIIGFSLGILAGISGKGFLKIYPFEKFSHIFLIVLGFYYLFFNPFTALKWNALLAIIFLLIIALIIKLVHKKLNIKKTDWFIDNVIMRFTEVFNAIPKIILILSVVAITGRSLWILIFIIAFSSWTSTMRIVRAEVLKISAQQFIEYEKSIASHLPRIVFKHILPNLKAIAAVLFIQIFSNAIIIEASLSFIGLGLPENMQTIGSLLFTGAKNIHAWWMIFFPGLTLTLLLISCNRFLNSAKH